MNHNQIRDWVKSRERPRLVRQDQQRSRVIEVGRQAQTVVDHPGWQVYCDHLAALRDGAEKEKQDLVTALADGEELGESLGALKLRLKGVRGRIDGYTQALELIPTLLERAADAAADLNK